MNLAPTGFYAELEKKEEKKMRCSIEFKNCVSKLQLYKKKMAICRTNVTEAERKSLIIYAHKMHIKNLTMQLAGNGVFFFYF